MWRVVIKDFIELYLGKDFFRSHLLIIGTSQHARDTAMHVLSDATVNYKFLGFINTKGGNSEDDIEKSDVVGNIGDLPYIIKKYPVDEVILAEPTLKKRELAKLMSLLGHKKIKVRSEPFAYENVITDMVLYQHGVSFSGPIIFTKPASWYWGLKRILDIILSTAILILTLPVMLLAIPLIKITSPGPVFYYQKRTGLNGVSFVIYKLRTMYVDSEIRGHPRWAKRHDKRITPVGNLLRRFRIDELPQLINVLKNNMSIIGPRPERPYFTNKLLKRIPFYAQRLQVKPGITGWAQVNFKYAATEEDTEKKLLYDLFYIQNMSLALDFLIALKTLHVVFAGRGVH